MALLHLPRSPSPRQARASDADLHWRIHGEVAALPSSPQKSVRFLAYHSSFLQKSKNIGAFAEKSGHHLGISPASKLLNTVSNWGDAFCDVERMVMAFEYGYGESFCSQRGWVMGTLTWGGFASAGGFMGFRELYQMLANRNVYRANPNAFPANPNVFSANPSLEFIGGDNAGSNSGSGGRGGGHGGYNSGSEEHFDAYNDRLAFISMHASYQDMDADGVSEHKAAFDSTNIMTSTVLPSPSSAEVHAKPSDHNLDGLSNCNQESQITPMDVSEPKMDEDGFSDQNTRIEVEKGKLSNGDEESQISHIDGEDTGFTKHGWNMYASLRTITNASTYDDGLNGKVSKNNRETLCSGSESSSQINSLKSDSVAEAGHLSQGIRAVNSIFSHLGRYILHSGWKFSEDSLEKYAIVPAQSGYSHGGTSWNHNADEMLAEAWDRERALDAKGLLAESIRELGILSLMLREMKLDAVLSLPEQLRAEKQGSKGQGIVHDDETHASVHEQSAAHHQQPQGVIDWVAQIARSALAKQTGSHETSYKAEHAEQDELKNSMSEGVAAAPKQPSETGGNSTAAKQSDMEALKRLQREAFSELMKIRERLEKIDQLAQVRQQSDLSGAARTHLKGEVKTGMAFVLLEDSSSRNSRGSLEQVGMQTGLDVRFTFETPFREKDVLITECVSGQGSSVGDGRALGGPMTLGKLQYVTHMSDNISFSFVPLGAQGKDVTEIINVLQDQGLTVFSSQGPALFNHCRGSALGATVSGSRFAFSFAQYLSGWGNHISTMESPVTEGDPLCLSTLGQFLLQPAEGLIVSLSGLSRYWPSPPLPSSMGLHWSEMGPLIIPKIQSLKTSRSNMTCQDPIGGSHLHISSLGSHWEAPDLEYGMDALEKSKGTALLSIAVASSVDLGENISVGGWVQIEKGDSIQDSDKGNFQWALSLARTSTSGIDWGASIGGSRPDFWSMTTTNNDGYPGYNGEDFYGPQLHVEAFLKVNCGRGFTLQPGLLYVSNKHSHTPAFVVRSSWSF